MTHQYVTMIGIGVAAAMLLGGMSASGAAQTANRLTGDITAASGKVVPAHSEVRALVERYSADERSLDRYFAIPFSSAHDSRFASFYQEWLDILKNIDFKQLNIDEQVDYLLLKNHLTRSLRKLRQDAAVVKEAAPYLPFAESIITLNENFRKTKWIEGDQAAKALAEIESKAREAREAIKTQLAGLWEDEGQKDENSVNRMVLKNAVSMLSTLRAGLKDWFDFYNGYNPRFTWWAAESYESADKELQAYESFLKEITSVDYSRQNFIFRDPVGREALVEELVYEMLPYTPEEILAIGWQELEWCEKERLAATQELGYGDDWRKAIEHVKNLAVEPGEQPELIRFLTFEAIDFLEKNDSLKDWP